MKICVLGILFGSGVAWGSVFSCGGHSLKLQKGEARLDGCRYRVETFREASDAQVPYLEAELRKGVCEGKNTLPALVSVHFRGTWPQKVPTFTLDLRSPSGPCRGRAKGFDLKSVRMALKSQRG